MRRGLLALLVVLLLTGCHNQWGAGSSWGGGSSSSAESNVRSAIPAVEAYYADNGTYAGMTLEGLRTVYDAALPEVTIVEANAKTYCVESTIGSESYFKAGPGANIWPGHCGDAIPEPPPPPAPAPLESFTDAQAAILDVIPAIEAFHADSGTYAGLDSNTVIYGVSLSQVRIEVLKGGTAYCVEAPRQAPSAHFVGPSGPLIDGPC
jgi:hypothetical protein